MNIYTIILYFITAAIILWRIIASYKKGFARELANAVSILIAVLLAYLLRNIYLGFTTEHIGKALSYLIYLPLIFGIYRLLKLILGALKIFASLPVIKILDKLLALFLGAGEGFVIMLFIVKWLKDFLA